jgi:tol-pal system protein YbgF
MARLQGHSPSRVDALRSQFRRSFGYYRRPPASPLPMVRTMLNRVALATIASAWVMAIPTAGFAQAGPADLMVRIDRLENQIRQLTGEMEQMQYRNQQLEAELRRLQGDNDFRSQELGSRGGPRVAAAPPPSYPPPQAGEARMGVPNQPGISGGRRSDAFDPSENPNAPGASRMLGSTAPPPPYPPPQAGEGRMGVPNQPAVSGGRRSDAFDPSENPNAPGVPRALGSIPPQPPPAFSGRGGAESTPYGAMAGAPAGADPTYGRLPAGGGPRNSGSTGPYAVATTSPSSSARDILDLGHGYLQHRDYALAEETFRGFLTKFPSDRLAAEAQFGLGESLFQRQNYHDAADAFVVLSKKYESSNKAPDALLRLGQSLAALNERELACVAFGDVGRKYPRASPSVKQAIEREQKRARC